MPSLTESLIFLHIAALHILAEQGDINSLEPGLPLPAL